MLNRASTCHERAEFRGDMFKILRRRRPSFARAAQDHFGSNRQQIVISPTPDLGPQTNMIVSEEGNMPRTHHRLNFTAASRQTLDRPLKSGICIKGPAPVSPIKAPKIHK
jgi:hypothetical protein